jgi:hypothetical protein
VTLKAFLFLFVVTLAAVVAGAFIAERLVAPGLMRGALIAILAGLVVFPAARWAEYRGWIKGDWSPGGELRKAQDARKTEQTAAGTDRNDPPAGDPTPPGDPR